MQDIDLCIEISCKCIECSNGYIHNGIGHEICTTYKLSSKYIKNILKKQASFNKPDEDGCYCEEHITDKRILSYSKMM